MLGTGPIAVAGGSGGCGKTTTALGVARALLARDVRARVVDLDVGMPNLHRLAGVAREPALPDVLADPSQVQVDETGVEVVPAPRVTASLAVDDALDVLELAHAATLLDCPAGAGPDVATPLRRADGVLLVASDRPGSVEDAAKTARMARSLGTPVVGAVQTRRDEPSGRARRDLPADDVVAIPDSEAPLRDSRVRARYGVVATLVLDALGPPRRGDGGTAEQRSDADGADSRRGRRASGRDRTSQTRGRDENEKRGARRGGPVR